MKNCLRVGQKLSNEFNFLSPKVSSRDRDLMGFDDCGTDMNIMIEDHWLLAHVMHRAGVFPSVGSARNQGWNKPIPEGVSEFTVGKAKKKVWILNEIKDL